MKKNKKNNEVEYENFFEVFMRNYKNVPGFKELVKLIVGGIFVFVLFVVMLGVNNAHRNDNVVSTTSTTTTTTTTKITYGDVLKTFLNNMHKVEINIKINNVDYLLNYNYKDNTIEGYLETIENTTKFKIINDIVYEIKMGKEIENQELFSIFDKKYIYLKELVYYLTNNKFIKDMDKYIYDNAIVYMNNNKINKIEVNENGNMYIINIS